MGINENLRPSQRQAFKKALTMKQARKQGFPTAAAAKKGIGPNKARGHKGGMHR